MTEVVALKNHLGRWWNAVTPMGVNDVANDESPECGRRRVSDKESEPSLTYAMATPTAEQC